MARLISYCMDALTVAVFLVPLLGLLFAKVWKGASRGRKGGFLLFVLYLAAVFSVTGTPSLFHLTFDPNLELVPFGDLLASPMGYILNVILFLPLGVFLPLLWEKGRSGKAVLLAGFGLSLCIELLQLFNSRATDVNDLITNTLGALLGYGGFLLLSKRLPNSGHAPAQAKGPSPAALTALTFLVTFLPAPLLSGFIWALVY